MSVVAFTRNVGVAPGTTTMQLRGRRWDPWTDVISLSDGQPVVVPPLVQDRPIRWDLVAVVGGGSLLVALGAAFLAAAFGRRGV